MNYSDFKSRIQQTTPARTLMDNPGAGTTEVLGYDGDILRYRRGKSRFRVSLRDLFAVVSQLRGQRVTSSALQRIAPEVFDSRAPHFGHSCNCTVLYLLLLRAGFVDGIGGAGVRGNPFFVDLP